MVLTVVVVQNPGILKKERGVSTAAVANLEVLLWCEPGGIRRVVFAVVHIFETLRELALSAAAVQTRNTACARSNSYIFSNVLFFSPKCWAQLLRVEV